MSDESYPGEADEVAAAEAACTPPPDVQAMTRQEFDAREDQLCTYSKGTPEFHAALSDIAVNDAAQRETIRRLEQQAEMLKGCLEENRKHADQLQARLTASEAAHKWTRERPTKEGWYWYRSIGDPADIVQVYESADGVWMIVGVNVRCMSIATFAAERDEYDELVHEDLQWQGPLTPGEE